MTRFDNSDASIKIDAGVTDDQGGLRASSRTANVFSNQAEPTRATGEPIRWPNGKTPLDCSSGVLGIKA